MIRTLRDRVSRLRHSVQYEIHRMTHKGGWQNYYQTSYEAPPSKPQNDGDVQRIGSEEGRFRCIRRKDGHIDSVIWEYKTDNADSMYARERREAAQREQLQEMDLDEIRNKLRQGELDCLSLDEVMKKVADQIDAHGSSGRTEGEISPLAKECVREIADREGYTAALEEYRDLMKLH